MLSDDAEWIINRWPHLTEARLPGTPRPWRQPPPKTAQQRYDERMRAQQENSIRPAFTLPDAPAPLNLDTFDLIHHILKRTRHLAIAVATELQHHAVLNHLQHHHGEHPADALRYLERHHDKTAETTQQHLQQQIRGIRARMIEEFAERFDGQWLWADCPWCHRPGLRVRLIGPAHALQPVVICEHDGCNPSTSECGKWWRGHPAWPFHEWEWLDQRINPTTTRLTQTG